MLISILAFCLFVEFFPYSSRSIVNSYFEKHHLTNLHYDIDKVSTSQIILKNITFNHVTDGGIHTSYYIRQVLLNYSLASIKSHSFTSAVINGLTINIVLPENFVQKAKQGFHLVLLPTRTFYANDVVIILRRIGYDYHRVSFEGNFNMLRDNHMLRAQMRGRVNYNGYSTQLRARGFHDLNSHYGEVQYQLIAPPLFQQRFNSLFFFPASVTRLSLFHGELYGYGVFYWYDIKDNPNPNEILYHLDGNVNILARDVIGSYGGIYFSGANGDLKFNAIEPFTNDDINSFTFKQVDLGILLTNVKMLYQFINFNNNIHGMEINAIRGNFLNGVVSAKAIKIKFSDPKRTFNVYLNQLELDQLVKYMGKEDWSAEGHLDGVLPVTATSGGITIKNGNVYATDRGVIRYRPSNPSTELTTSRGGKLLYELLYDFRYTTLQAKVSHDLYDETYISMLLMGSSQKLYNGIPVKFNINTHGRLVRVLQDVNVGKSVGRQLQRLIDKE